MAKIAILHNEPRLRQVSYGYHKPPGEGASLTVLSFDLKPGLNVIDADVWERAKAQNMTKLWLTEGLIEEGPALADGINPFADLPPRTAAKMVLETMDRQVLERAARTEQREPILEVLEFQRTKVDAESKGKDPPEEPDAVRRVNELPDDAPVRPVLRREAGRKGKK